MPDWRRKGRQQQMCVSRRGRTGHHMPLTRGNGNDLFVERRRIVVGGARFGGTGAQRAGTPMETSPPEPFVERRLSSAADSVRDCRRRCEPQESAPTLESGPASSRQWPLILFVPSVPDLRHVRPPHRVYPAANAPSLPLSVRVTGPRLWWLGPDRLVFGSLAGCRPVGLAVLRFADARCEGPVGVT